MAFQNEEEVMKEIESKINQYPDFPKPGVLFRDITPILSEPRLFDSLIDILCARVKPYEFDRVLGIESRGFLLGPLISNRLKLSFIPIRKKGKLPGDVYSVSYSLEYGVDTLEVQKACLPQGAKCLVVDDLIATGGSFEAVGKLVDMAECQIAAFVAIIELKFLEGRRKLTGKPVVTLFSY